MNESTAQVIDRHSLADNEEFRDEIREGEIGEEEIGEGEETPLAAVLAEAEDEAGEALLLEIGRVFFVGDGGGGARLLRSVIKRTPPMTNPAPIPVRRDSRAHGFW